MIIHPYHSQAAKKYGVKVKDETNTFYTPESEAVLWDDF